MGRRHVHLCVYKKEEEKISAQKNKNKNLGEEDSTLQTNT